ncbi:formyl peptide receptor-related sequence 4-like [Clytia hemisphaerica]|uniref:G-protein coupled receptors family 1 profile domain-containing protein n=1 Tax=Clytia hemisphaerica TaxID=252671 RepID=A0A7M5UV81_9CNID
MSLANERFSLISFSLILILGSIGNALVIYVYGIAGNERRRRFMKFERLMLMLGVVDFVASITNPLYYIYMIVRKNDFNMGETMCKIIPTLGPLFTMISLGIILIMAIDRDRAVATPFKPQFNLKSIYKAVALTVLLCVLTITPYVYKLKIQNYFNRRICAPVSDTEYNIFAICLFLSSDLIFLTIFVVTTFRIFRKLKTKDTIECPKMKQHRAKETNRILKIITSMGVLFICCVFPRDLLLTSFSFSTLIPPPVDYAIAADANLVLKVLHTFNSCVNVILYSLLNKKFRKSVLKLFMKSKTFSSLYLKKYPTLGRDTDSYDSSQTHGTLTRSPSVTPRTSPRGSPRTSLIANMNSDKKCSQTLLKHVLTKPLYMESKN